MSGPVPSSKDKPPILVNPEGYEDLLLKHKTREEEKLAQAQQRWGTNSREEQIQGAIEANKTKQSRGTGERTALKDHEIKKEPSSEVEKTRHALATEIAREKMATSAHTPAKLGGSGRKFTQGPVDHSAGG